MHKHCPFCKKEVQQDTARCPHCGMTIRESFATTHHAHSSTSAHSSTTQKKPNLFKQAKEKVIAYLHRPKVYRASYTKSDVYKKWAIAVMVALFVYGLYSASSQTVATNQNLAQPTNYVAPTLTPSPQHTVIVPPPNTGTVIKRDYDYLQGNGKLRISNGTSLDAVAKLVYADHSVYSVYIRAGGEYTISGISDGYYRLMFALGNNWHSDTKMFALNSAYSKFDESFDFITRDSGDGVYYYRTFEVTLNPVAGGQATTENANPAEFNNY